MRAMFSRSSIRKAGSAAALVLLSRSAAPAQQAGGGAMQQAVQAKLAQVKQDAAANQAALRQYGWAETIQVAVNGEVKQTRQMSCRYGPDGKPQCAPVGAPPPQQQAGGLRGRIGHHVGVIELHRDVRPHARSTRHRPHGSGDGRRRIIDRDRRHHQESGRRRGRAVGHEALPLLELDV